MIRPLITIIGLTLLAQTALAESPGDRVIRLMDEKMTLAKDQSFVFEVITQEPGKALRKMSMKVQIKGKTWRRIEFLSPGDVKGMKVLIRSLSQMYVYLPAYHKIRRVASNVRSQNFMGTANSQDDMSITTYGNIYAGKLISETKDTWKVMGTRRPGKSFPYRQIEFTILKKERHPSKLVYFSDKGKKLKTETRTDHKCKGKICNAFTMKMIDHTRNGMWTKLLMTNWEVNSGLPDSHFTSRSLQRR